MPHLAVNSAQAWGFARASILKSYLMSDFILTTPIAFIIFNRPDNTERVFAEIAKAKPTKLLVVADGARTDKSGVAELVSSVVSYNGTLEFDSTKPDGTMRKLMNVSFMQSLGWQASTSLVDGLVLAYKNYVNR